MKKIIKYVVIGVLIIVSGILLFNNHVYEEQIVKDAAETVNETTESKNQIADLSDMEIKSYYSFSEGYAIIQYERPVVDEDGNVEDIRAIAYINKKGEIQPLNNMENNAKNRGIRIYPDYKFKPFIEGVSYAFFDDYVVQVKKSEDILEQTNYYFDENEIVLDCGGGVALVQCDESGYTSSTGSLKIYRLKDNGEKELTISYEFDKNEISDPDGFAGTYIGHEKFRVNTYEKIGIIDPDNGYQPLDILELGEHTLGRVNYQTSFESGICKDNNLFVVGSVQKKNPNVRTTEIVYIDEGGKVATVEISGLWNISQCNSSGWILCGTAMNPGAQDSAMSYNLLTGEKHTSNENIEVNDTNEIRDFTDNNEIALDVRGEDGELYIAVLNTNLELLADPVEGFFPTNISDGVFLANDSSLYKAYDEDCELLFETDEYYAVYNYKDGVAAAFEKRMPNKDLYEYWREANDSIFSYDEVTYLDKEGMKLFDVISYVTKK